MNRYIITCINDFETYSGYAAYAESLFDEDMNNAADAYAFENRSWYSSRFVYSYYRRL